MYYPAIGTVRPAGKPKAARFFNATRLFLHIFLVIN